MSESRWTPKLKKSFRIQKGMGFDVRTGQWYIPQPKESRPFFEAKKSQHSLPMIVLDDPDCVFIMIGPQLNEGESIQLERITRDEFALISTRTDVTRIELGKDAIVTGPGPLIGLTLGTPAISTLKPGERGLVLTSGIRTSEAGDLMIRSGFEPEELRGLLLFWDRLDWPEHNIFQTAIDADAEFLISEGIMLRTQILASGVLHSRSALENLHHDALRQREAVEPGLWSLALGSQAMALSPDTAEKCLLVDLFDAIAIPSRETPLEDVLTGC